MNGFRFTIVVAVLVVLVSIMTGDDDWATFGFVLAYLFAAICFVLALVRSFWRPASRTRATHIRTSLVDWCWWLAFALPLAWILLTVGIPGPYAREVGRRMACSNNLRQIGLAMRNYAQVYRSFPPAYIADRNGRPLLSWRVLILPFMELDDLYKKIRLNEPWDSPHNREVLQRTTVAAFHCPSATNPESETSYVMVVGPNTISDGPHSVRFEDIKDGSSNTIMFVEIKDSGIHWAEPRDLDFGSMSFRVNDPKGRGISSYHPGVAGVELADGSHGTIGDDIDPKLLKALITINGGEDVSKFFRNE